MDPEGLKKAEAEFRAKYGQPNKQTAPSNLTNRGPINSGAPISRGPMGPLTGAGRGPPRLNKGSLPMNNFLAQRLNNAKGQQFFDSGDYNMNKSKLPQNKPIYAGFGQGQKPICEKPELEGNKENIAQK